MAESYFDQRYETRSKSLTVSILTNEIFLKKQEIELESVGFNFTGRMRKNYYNTISP